MALQTQPGFVGFKVGRVSSMDGRALGKLTDTNHLSSLRSMAPADYDKKIISLYTQTSTYSNDFLQMLGQSSQYLPDGNTWKWEIGVPFMNAVIVEIPATTLALPTPGIDGQPFEIVVDKQCLFKNSTFKIGDRRYGPMLHCIDDGTDYGTAWKYKVTYVTNNPMTDYVDSMWLAVGLDIIPISSMIGESDDELPGLGPQGSTITLFESISAGHSAEHAVTAWADAMTPRDEKGRPLDIVVYAKERLNEKGEKKQVMLWEPFIEQQLRKKMMDDRVAMMMWGNPGTAVTGNNAHEVKKAVEGLYWKIRNNGNYLSYPRGEFSLNIFRNVFGDMFYRREDMANRHVTIYTNEAGFDVFDEAAANDLKQSGLTIIADNRFIEGTGRNMVFNYAFSGVVTRETGRIKLVHLKQLDEPQTNLEFGANKKSTPTFIVFDIDPSGDGTPRNNVREVRPKGAPAMTWGYVDGRWSHLGFAASQGMQSANTFPGYKIWFDERVDIFVEDMTRMFLIEETPLYP